MDVNLDLKGRELVAVLSGEADSLQGEPGSLLKEFRRIDDLASRERPARVRIDFRGLVSMEEGAFRLIAEEIGWISKRLPVALVGPGAAMQRFFAERDRPPGWRWEESEGMEPAGGASPPASGEEVRERSRTEAFEIDLEREFLLRESEPPVPPFNPLAEPLDLFPGVRGGAPDCGEPAPPPAGPSPEEKDHQESGERGQYLFLPEEPGGEDRADFERLDIEGDLGEEGALRKGFEASGLEASGGFRTAAGDDLPKAQGTPAPVVPVQDPPAVFSRREQFLSARLINSLLSEDFLRARLAELEAQLLRRPEHQGVLKEPPGAVPPAPRAAALRAPRTSLRAEIPSFLRGDFPRGSIVAAVARLIERRSRGRGVPAGAILEVASSLATAVERAPFAGFDFSQARTGAHPAAQVVYVTATALCLLQSSGASRERLRRLALAAFLQTLGSGGANALRLLGEEGPSRALSRRLARRLSSLLPRVGEAGVDEEEVLDGLQLLELSSSFWQRIGPGPEGGAHPASAAAALVRGEIGRGVPDHFRRLFLRAFSAFPPGTWVRLESGEVGVVVGPGSKEVRRLVDTGVERAARVRAVVACPLRACPAPPELLRIGTGVAMR